MSGAVQCWGRGRYGENGSLDFSDVSSPQLVSPLPAATSLDAGSTFTCVTVADGARCWGDNREGQLGDGLTTDSPSPVTVLGMGPGAISVALGRDHSCALRNGRPVCWGRNDSGQLGDGTTFARADLADVLPLP